MLAGMSDYADWASATALRLRDGREGRTLWVMAKEPERFDPKERAREKQRSREEDARALASGEKSPEELQRENGHFSFPNAGKAVQPARLEASRVTDL